MPDVSQIYVYPLKSAAGIALEQARVTRRGLAGDRRWMVVDEEGVFITQRTHPTLALVSAREADGTLRLAAPSMPPLAVAAPATLCERPVEVWEGRVPAADAGDEAARWLERYLGRPCRLVYQPDAVRRPVDAEYAVHADDHVSFADGYPLLLAAEASLADLNARLQQPVPMNRFRPNLVVAGTAPFEEDGWSGLTIGGMRFHVVKPCARCTIITIDQATGEPGKEPLRTLSRYRKEGSKVLFGQNLIPESEGVIRVGDVVELW